MTLLERWLSDRSFVNWAKQLDDNDIAKWEEYLNSHPEHWELAKAGRLMVIGIPFQKIESDAKQREKSLAVLMERLNSTANIPVKNEVIRNDLSRVLTISKRWYVAASMAVFMLISGVSYFQFFHSSEVLYTTGYGEQTEILMPDGSKVTLNANSRLAFHSKDPRIVQLEGEAFFEVKKTVETVENFQVLTHDLTVTVRGTSFNVNARNDQTKVFLEEGKIELEINDSDQETIEMDPGDLISYSKKEKKLKENRKNVSALENSSWKDGTLIFNKTSLIEALYDIEDIYGIQFVLESDNLKEEEITGGVPIRDLKVTLETLNEIYNIQVKAEGKRYFLRRDRE